jgi:hypothetical protein
LFVLAAALALLKMPSVKLHNILNRSYAKLSSSFSLLNSPFQKSSCHAALHAPNHCKSFTTSQRNPTLPLRQVSNNAFPYLASHENRIASFITMALAVRLTHS